MTNDSDVFAAELLERSAAGLAGYAASSMIETAPEMLANYAPDAFGHWKTHLGQRVLELAAALRADERALFTERVVWSRKAFLAREQDELDLVASLTSLRDVLTRELPASAQAKALEILDAALDLLAEPPPPLDESELDPSRSGDRLALTYLERVLEGRAAEAIDELVTHVRGGMPALEVYTGVLLPAQREIGRLWHLGEINIPEEHVVTFATQRAMSVVAHVAPAPPANGKSVVAAAVAGNAHEIGLRAVSDAFQLSGWRSIFLGSDVPGRDLASAVTFFGADLLLLTATLSTHIARVQDAITTLRARSDAPPKVLVGGNAFDEAPEVYERVGADGYAATLDAALAEGARLVEL